MSGRPEKNRNKTGGRFAKGQSGNPRGRPAGVPNKATAEIKSFSLELLGDPAYRRVFMKAWRTRTLPTQIELAIWYWAYGKPPQAIELSGSFDPAAYLASLTPDR